MRAVRALPMEPVKFAAVGLLNTLVDMATFWLLITWAQTPILLANTFAYGLGTLNSYTFNRIWTFRKVEAQASPLRQLPRFVSITLVGLGISNLTVWIAVMFVPPMWAKLLATGATFLWNYAASKKWVYRAEDLRVT